MKNLILLVGIFLWLVSPALADLNQGRSAYERGDYVKAFNEFKTSAEEGNADAQLMLGYMYAEGEGTLQNFVEAHKWFNLSASRGNQKAKKARNIITDKMTAEQIATAQRLAIEWKPTVSKKSMEEAKPKKVEMAPKSAERPSRAEIKEIQKILVDLGYDPGYPDGVIGNKITRREIIYQYTIPVIMGDCIICYGDVGRKIIYRYAMVIVIGNEIFCYLGIIHTIKIDSHLPPIQDASSDFKMYRGIRNIYQAFLFFTRNS